MIPQNAEMVYALMFANDGFIFLVYISGTGSPG